MCQVANCALGNGRTAGNRPIAERALSNDFLKKSTLRALVRSNCSCKNLYRIPDIFAMSGFRDLKIITSGSRYCSEFLKRFFEKVYFWGIAVV